MRRAAYALVALTVVACSSSAPSSSSTSTSTSTAVSTTTTTIATTTTTVPLEPQPSPHDAAVAFAGAWKAGDPASASTVAVASAVQSAFAAGTPAFTEDRGCMSGDFDLISCVFRTDLGEAQVRTTKSGDGWIVDQVKVTPA